MRLAAPALMALAALLSLPLPAAAQQLLASYSAFIAPEDLRNSRGQGLRDPWAVLRQDRANFHRYGIRQFADEYDPVFLSADARAQMQRLVAQGRIDPAARRVLRHGGGIVHVRVYGQGRQLHAVTVGVARQIP
jgi:hypothetical protein